MEDDTKARQARIAMLQELTQTPGWQWFVAQIDMRLSACQSNLDNLAPVGEGAALLARNQGGKAAYLIARDLAANTMKADHEALTAPKDGPESA